MSQVNPTQVEIDIAVHALIVEGVSQTEAFKRAYPKSKASDKSLRVRASEFFKHPTVLVTKRNVQNQLADDTNNRLQACLGRTVEDVVQEIGNIAFCDVDETSFSGTNKLNALERLYDILKPDDGGQEQESTTQYTAEELIERIAARQAELVEMGIRPLRAV